jgi:hypothetical protein
MKFEKTIWIVIITACLVLMVVIKLFQNIAAEPWSLKRVFSQQNIIEATLLLLVIVAIVVPIRVIIGRRKVKK